MQFEKTAILGVGLLGASLAIALRQKGMSACISGYGRREENLLRAREKGIIDSYSLTPSGAVQDADLVVFATPVGTFVEIAAMIKGSLKKGSIQTDVGSVKGRLVFEMEKILPRFVGCHPISGGERSGVEAASGSLFEGARCIITKTPKTDEQAFRAVFDLWSRAGANVELMDPVLHDEVYALVSHLPHVIAYSLVNTVRESGPELIRFAGQGFKDTTRIALSSPELWRDICSMNSGNLVRFIDTFKRNLEIIQDSLKEGDAQKKTLEREFEAARGLRQSIENRD